MKGLDPALGRPDVVSGTTILGDGRVACILDADAHPGAAGCRRERRRLLRFAGRGSAREAARRCPTPAPGGRAAPRHLRARPGGVRDPGGAGARGDPGRRHHPGARRRRPHVRGVTNLRGRILPVVELRTRLGLDAGGRRPRARASSWSRCATGCSGLLVDAVLQVAKVPLDDRHRRRRRRYARPTRTTSAGWRAGTVDSSSCWSWSRRSCCRSNPRDAYARTRCSRPSRTGRSGERSSPDSPSSSPWPRCSGGSALRALDRMNVAAGRILQGELPRQRRRPALPGLADRDPRHPAGDARGRASSTALVLARLIADPLTGARHRWPSRCPRATSRPTSGASPATRSAGWSTRCADGEEPAPDRHPDQRLLPRRRHLGRGDLGVLHPARARARRPSPARPRRPRPPWSRSPRRCSTWPRTPRRSRPTWTRPRPRSSR